MTKSSGHASSSPSAHGPQHNPVHSDELAALAVLCVTARFHQVAAEATRRQAEIATVKETIANQDIGFVNAGHMTVVKLETFPYTKYGTVQAWWMW